jgi:hypothetical protein
MRIRGKGGLLRGLLQQTKLRQQGITPFDSLWIHWNARNRAHLHTLGLIEMAHAFGAFVGVNFVNLWPQEDGFVRALGLTHIAVDAFVGDHQGHKKSVSGLNKKNNYPRSPAITKEGNS